MHATLYDKQIQPSFGKTMVVKIMSSSHETASLKVLSTFLT